MNGPNQESGALGDNFAKIVHTGNEVTECIRKNWL